MPIRLRDLARGRKRLELNWAGESFFVEYATGQIGAMTLDGIIGLNDANDHQIAALAPIMDPFLADVVVDWDVLGEDDAPYPRTPEALADLPFMFKLRIMIAIMDDQRDPLALATSGAN